MKTILVVVLFASVLAAPLFGQCSDSDKTALEALDRSWGMANFRGDVATLKTLFAEDFRQLPGLGTKADLISGVEEQAAANGGSPPAGGPAVTWDRYIITCTPASATITHRNIIPGQNGGPPNWARSIHVLEKRGGKWQIVSTTGHAMDDQMVLYYMDQDWTDANARRDRAWYEANFAEDFSSVGSADGKIYNKEEDIEDTLSSTEKILMTASDPNIIKVDGNYGSVTGTYHYKATDKDGKAIDRHFRYTDTYIKRDGRWQVWTTISVPMSQP